MDYVFNKYLGTVEELEQYVGKPICCLSFKRGSCYIKHVTGIHYNVTDKVLEIKGKFTVWLHILKKFGETDDERVIIDVNFGTSVFSFTQTNENFAVRTLTETEFELYNRMTKKLRYLDALNKLDPRTATIISFNISEGVF